MDYKLPKCCFTQYFHILVHLNMNVHAHVLHVHSDIYTYLYAFTGYSVKDGTTGKRDDWLCKNKLKTSRNEMLLLKSRKEKKNVSYTTDVVRVRF